MRVKLTPDENKAFDQKAKETAAKGKPMDADKLAPVKTGKVLGPRGSLVSQEPPKVTESQKAVLASAEAAGSNEIAKAGD